MSTIGFIGLGQMGMGMAKNLIKAGHSLVAYDINQTSLDEISSLGAIIAESPKSVAQQATTIVTMVPTDAHVEDIYLNSETGLISGLSADTLFIESSTIKPSTVQKVSKKLEENKCSIVDAPVSGGTAGANAGTLTFMCGGQEDSFERASLILENMGSNIVRVGPSGSGQIAKLCNNLILSIHMIGVSEAMNLGVKLGADPKVLNEIVNTSSGQCWTTTKYSPVPGIMESPASKDYQGGFASKLMLKDIILAKEAADSVGAKLPLGDPAREYYEQLVENGLGDKDFSVVYDSLSKS